MDRTNSDDSNATASVRSIICHDRLSRVRFLGSRKEARDQYGFHERTLCREEQHAARNRYETC